MKKIVSLMMAALLSVSMLTGCSSKEEKEITNEVLVNAINNSGNEGVEFCPTVALDADKTEDAEMLDLFFEQYDIDKENMEKGAFSVSMINIKAYAIMAIQPKEGEEDDVMEDMQEYIESMKKSFERYLQDQYEIASNAILKQEDNGVIILVMAEDAQTTYDNIVKALA